MGINGTDCIVELEKVKPTSFYGSMLLSAKAHGYKTSEMMYKWIKESVEPPSTRARWATLITRENFRQVFKEQGVREKECFPRSTRMNADHLESASTTRRNSAQTGTDAVTA